MFLSASHSLPPVFIFDADGAEIKHCLEIDTETGMGVQCQHLTHDSLSAVPISLDFVDGDTGRLLCQWKALELVAFSKFHNLKTRIDTKGRAMSEKYKKAFEKLQRRLDHIDGSVKIALYEFQNFTVLPLDDCEIL
jgi:hypothetical protein